MPRKLSQLPEADLQGPFFQSLWHQSKDLWLPGSDGNWFQIKAAVTESMPVDEIPADNSIVIASCLDSLFIDHADPGQFQTVATLSRIEAFASSTAEDQDYEQWISLKTRRAITIQIGRTAHKVEEMARRDLVVQESIFNKRIAAHTQKLFLVTRPNETRSDPDMGGEQRYAYFAAHLAGVALRWQSPDKFSFEPVVQGCRSRRAGLLPDDTTIVGVYHRVE